MASLRLGRYEVEKYHLPQVCAKCGDKAVVAPAKRFSWHPQWVIVLIFAGLLIYVIVAVILTKRMTVRLPFCERHRHYWRNRALFMFGGLVGVLLLGVGAAILASALDDRDGSNLFGVACGGSVVLGLVWLIAAAIVQTISIRTNEITDDSISLVGVSEDFREAVREDRRSHRDDDEDDRPRAKRRPAEEDDERVRRKPSRDDDDDRPSRRREAKEDDGDYYDPEAKRRDRHRDEDDR